MFAGFSRGFHTTTIPQPLALATPETTDFCSVSLRIEEPLFSVKFPPAKRALSFDKSSDAAVFAIRRARRSVDNPDPGSMQSRLDFAPRQCVFCYRVNAELLPRPKSVKSRPANGRAAVQAVYLQNLIIETTGKDVKPAELSGLARAWCDLQEERRKLAMRPVPRPIDTTKLQPRRRRGAQSVEPIEPK